MQLNSGEVFVNTSGASFFSRYSFIRLQTWIGSEVPGSKTSRLDAGFIGSDIFPQNAHKMSRRIGPITIRWRGARMTIVNQAL
jgi:hypothetical protein